MKREGIHGQKDSDKNAGHIYKELGDGEQFLELKLANLRYGSDYVELVEYYKTAGNP